MPPRIIILGGGPAGLAAAWQLHRRGKARATVLEQRDAVGGNAGSVALDGVPVDYGSHRLHPACQADIFRDLSALLGHDLLDRPRHGRVYLHGRWIHFPLKPLDLMFHLPWWFSLGVAGDGLRKVLARPQQRHRATFAGELERGLGATICRDFYFPYAVKIWGLPAQELSATQARKRVAAGSLAAMVRKLLAAVPGLKPPGAGRFFYPRHGFGQISQAIASAASALGADIQLRTTVRRVILGPPLRLELERDGVAAVIEADRVWSTIPVTVLARLLEPAPPAEILAACGRINYRAMVLIYLVLAQPQFTPFDAHYFPGRDIALTRLSEPKNYSGRLDPADRTILCGELPCAVGDALWASSDEALGELVCNSLARCGLPVSAPVLSVVTKRLPQAYPIYHRDYEEPLQQLHRWIGELAGVLTFGRQGLFAHDNTHHTLAMAYAAVECLRDDGHFDARRWAQYRSEFESHVVED
ncbi:MAG: FAD-dependent oxidoreductase [Deltaproteobacteria bacterium]|nr:FAD-dependent oxidoreductase [Deltaproteobacteria bacterium]